MFREEAVFRKQCKKERDEAELTMNEVLSKFKSIEKQRNDLKSELERKERLSLQAIAARSNMKKYLDEAQDSLKKTEGDRDGLQSKLNEAG